MNRFFAGTLIGAALGIVDGGTAWFTPAVRPIIMSILIGSCVKGMLVGILSAAITRKLNSPAVGITTGAVIGLLLAWGVAALPEPNGEHYYLQIMLPGF